MDIVGQLDKINRMPLYRLTLNSMENTHSEMLQYLFEWYPKESKNILSEWLDTSSSDFDILESVREKDGHKDLLIQYKSHASKHIHKMIIENKLKALPTLQQLEKYSANKPYSIGILLSLSKPVFLKNTDSLRIGKMHWHYVSYKRLEEGLKKIIPLIREKNEQDAIYFTDYH
ncbi:PDDEXK-like family protein, partial [Paenibacillus chitinolyticus]